VSQGRLMVARRWSFKSSTSRMVSMSSMLPTLSLMLSEAGASLMGQVAVLGAGAVGAGSCTGAGSSAAASSDSAGGTSPSAPRWISAASRCLQACKCFW